MWILLRILTLIAVYVWKFFWRKMSVGALQPYRDTFRVKKEVRHKGRFVRMYRGLAYNGPLRFQITREGSWDGFFKSLGLAVEQQAGDAGFDRDYYLTCDQPSLGEMLAQRPSTREAIHTLFAAGAKQVFTDGERLWADIKKESHDGAKICASLYELRAGLLTIDPTNHRNRRDAFFWKALAVESLVWGIAAYGVPGFFELAWHRNTLYADAWPVFRTGFIWSAVGLAMLCAGIVLLFRHSSRGHRIIAESVLVLLVGVPFSSVQMVSDINIGMDTSVPQWRESLVTSQDKEVRRRRRGRTSTHYFLNLRPQTNGGINGRLEVESSLFSQVRSGSVVVVKERGGRLGFPWIESIQAKR